MGESLETCYIHQSSQGQTYILLQYISELRWMSKQINQINKKLSTIFVHFVYLCLCYVSFPSLTWLVGCLNWLKSQKIRDTWSAIEIRWKWFLTYPVGPISGEILTGLQFCKYLKRARASVQFFFPVIL